MTLSSSHLLIALCGVLVGGGLALLVAALVGMPTEDRVAREDASLAELLQKLGKRVPLAVIAGLGVLVATRWLVAAVACGVLVLIWEKAFGGGQEIKLGVARIEALAAWTESLRDTVAGAVGLEQAIPATTYAAAPVIRPDLETLSDRLRVRMPLPDALKRFAEDMNDASADLIIAALILNARLRGPGLRDVLTSLSKSARMELEMRQRVNAGRASTRRSVQIIVVVSVLFIIGLALFNPGYVAPYGTPMGQVALLVIFAFFSAGILWLRSLAKFDAPARFLQFRQEVKA